MITPEQASVGTEVTSNVDWPDVPKGTKGVIVEDYGTGVMVAWDLPDKGMPYPDDMTAEEVGKLWAANHKCPLRDGFDKKDEFQYLELWQN